MSDEHNKKMIELLNVRLAERGHKNFHWDMPEDEDNLFQITGAEIRGSHVVIAATNRSFIRAAGELTIKQVESLEKAMPILPIKGSTTETDETTQKRASNTVTFNGGVGKGAHYYMGATRKIAMPPGMWMSRIAHGVFFFSPKTVDRVFEEIIADYRHEMIEAEAKGRTSGEIRRLRIQHWGGFVTSVVEELFAGLIGKIIRVLKGG